MSAFSSLVGYLAGKNNPVPYKVLDNGDGTCSPQISDQGTAAVATATGIGSTAANTAAAQLVSVPLKRGFYVESDAANTALLYLGPSSITTAGANAFLSLAPGQRSPWLPFINTNALYVIAASGAPTYRVIGA